MQLCYQGVSFGILRECYKCKCSSVYNCDRISVPKLGLLTVSPSGRFFDNFNFAFPLVRLLCTTEVYFIDDFEYKSV
jgi:hypothetical protein